MNLKTGYENSSIYDINVIMQREICFMCIVSIILTLMIVMVKMIIARAVVIARAVIKVTAVIRRGYRRVSTVFHKTVRLLKTE